MTLVVLAVKWSSLNCLWDTEANFPSLSLQIRKQIGFLLIGWHSEKKVYWAACCEYTEHVRHFRKIDGLSTALLKGIKDKFKSSHKWNATIIYSTLLFQTHMQLLFSFGTKKGYFFENIWGNTFPITGHSGHVYQALKNTRNPTNKFAKTQNILATS